MGPHSMGDWHIHINELSSNPAMGSKESQNYKKKTVYSCVLSTILENYFPKRLRDRSMINEVCLIIGGEDVLKQDVPSPRMGRSIQLLVCLSVCLKLPCYRQQEK